MNGQGSNKQTPKEWRREFDQMRVDMLKAALYVEAAREQGIVIGGWVIDHQRCRELIAEARARGVEPSADGIERLLLKWREGGWFRRPLNPGGYPDED